MTAARRPAPLPLLLIGLAALCAALALIPWILQAQSQAVTPTAAATGANPPAKPTNLQASAVHDSVALTWTASTDQTVTHYAILRRNSDVDASGVFHVIESNAGPGTSYSDGSVSASTTYIYRVKAVSPTGVSQWSGYVKAETPAAPPPISTPTPTPTSTPTPEPVSTPTPEDLAPTGLTVSLVDNEVTLSWTAPAEDADSVDGYEILRRRPMEGESALATLVADTESTATTYTDATANEAGVRYVYRVKALRGDDVSLWSNYDRIELPSDYVPDPTPTPEPESTSDDRAPASLSAALADGGGVTLSWTAPSDDAEGVTGYEVLRAVGDEEMATLAADTGSTTTTYTDATATDAGETYAYQVKAIRGEDRSQASGQAEVQVPHDPVDLAPTGLTAVVLTASLVVVGEEESTPATSIRLSWTAPAEDAGSVTGYEILRAVGDGELATLKADTGSTSTFYNDATATQSGTSYAYKVKAIRGADRSEASEQSEVQIPHDAVDLAPSDLAVEAVDGGGVSLSWSAPAEDAGSVTGYEILRAVGEGDMATLATDTASTTTTYTDATATGEGETYAYRVKAVRGQARSRGSNRVALVPVEPPATPENLKPTNLTFEIREDGVTLAWDAPAADAGSVTGYRVVRRRPNQGENEWLVWKWDTGSTETTYRDGYARTHGEYCMYRVRALRGDDYSKMSNRVDVRRPEATPQTTEWAPSNLQARMYFEVALGEDGVTTQVKLTWDAPAEGVEWVGGYEVQRATCDGDFTTLAADTGSTETAYDDATFEEGESYTYRVRARRPQGLSLTSNTWTILVPGGTGESECAVPTALPSQVQTPQTGRLTPATLENTLLGYSEEEGAGTLEPNEVTFDEDATFRVAVVSAWPGIPGLVLMLTAGSSVQDAALADRDFILEADETVLIVSTTEFSFDDATVTHSDTTGDNGEYTGVVIATWPEGEPGLAAGETVAFRLELRDRPEEAQFSQHERPGQAFNTLSAAGNDNPQGLWSDGTTMWVADYDDAKIYAYDMATKDRVPGEDFNTLDEAGNDHPRGLWSDGSIMWVADFGSEEKIYAYDMATKDRVPGRDFNNLHRINEEGDYPEAYPWGIWSGGNIMWVVDNDDDNVYAYDLNTKARVPGEDFTGLTAVGNTVPTGIWADETTMFVANHATGRIYAYWRSTKFPDPARYISLEAGNDQVVGIWSDGSTMWVSDSGDDKIYAYELPVAVPEPTYDGASVEHLTADSAVLTVDVQALPFDIVPSDQRVLSISINFGSASMYVHPQGGAARFLLRGLEPETEYAVEVKFGLQPSHTLGTVIFTTPHAQLGGIEVSDLTHTTATVTVSLPGADVERGCCFNYWVSYDRSEPERTYYLRHKRESDSGWSQPVTLTFSGSTDAALSGLDPGTVYDVQVYEHHPAFTFVPPNQRVDNFPEGTWLEELGAFTTPPLPPTLAFEAEMTVGVSTALDGYHSGQGSISSNTFEVGGVQYTVHSVGFLKGSDNEFQLTVTSPLPFDSFTLTLGSTELLSSSAIVTTAANGTQTDYEWSGTNPSWSNNDKVAVKLDIGLIDICGRSPAVAHVIREATPSFDFCHMTSVLDLDDLTELDLPGGRGTGLKAGDFEGLSGLTHLDLSWYDLGGLRPQLPVGVFDGLDSLIHLDISHTGLMSLGLGVFEGLSNLEVLDLSDTLLQRLTVPVGVFDGLDNLEVLRLTNLGEHYENTFSNLDDDLFFNQSFLRELDVRPSNPLRDSPRSLLPLTSLVTYNGRPYTRPADPPANFQYASGRIDHERGYFKTCYAVTLKWDAPAGVSGITGYRILRNLGAESLSRYAKQIATTGASARTFIDGRDADVCFGGVGSGPNVSYFVSAIIGNKDSFPARVRVDQTRAFPATQVPSTPTLRGSLYDLSVARSPNGYKVRLQWNDLHHNITGYEISFRGSSTAAWRTIVANAGNVLEYDLESVPILPSSVPRTAENMYLYNAFRDQGDSLGFTDDREFRIRALNAAGNSGWSNVVRPFQ